MKRVLFIAFTAVVMTSCKKESGVNPNPAPEVTKKMANYTYVYDTDAPETTTYSYDAQGRIASIADDDFSETLQQISATQLLVTERNVTDNTIRQTKECTLNDKGYITSMVFKNAVGATIHTYTFTYNAEGHLVNKKGTTPSGSINEQQYIIANGNVVSSKTYYDGILSSTNEYTVDNTKPNKIMQVAGAYWICTPYFGKPNNNLWKEVKTTNAAGTVTWHTKVTYAMDAAGYPLKTTTHYILDGKLATQAFTYN